MGHLFSAKQATCLGLLHFGVLILPFIPAKEGAAAVEVYTAPVRTMTDHVTLAERNLKAEASSESSRTNTTQSSTTAGSLAPPVRACSHDSTLSLDSADL